MSESTSITTYPREVVGKANRKLASANRIPAVLYGPGIETQVLSVDRHDFELLMSQRGGTQIVTLALEGEKRPVDAVIREVQHSPVKGTILHIDFQAIRMDVALHITVPIHLRNDPAGVKAGGVLTVNLHELNIEAMPADLPEFIEWDVSPLEVGDSVHVSDLVVPRGVTVLDDSENIVCSVTPPTVAIEEEVVSEEVEPEVIGEKPAGEEA